MRKLPHPFRKLVRFVHQWTIPTKSDHDALVVHVQIRNRWGGPWRDLFLVSVNMGGRFDRHDLLKIVAALRAYRAKLDASGEWVLAFQEGGDQPWLPAALHAHGMRYLGGHRPGEASTPVGVSAGIDVLHDEWDPIVGPVNVGAGAGPSRSKTKGWRRTRLRLTDARFGASSFHQYASIMRRWRWVIRLAGPIVRAITHMGRPYFLIGDTNSDDDQPFVPWLLRRGMTTNHRVLGEVATHGRRSIDAVAVASRWVLGAGR